jgi:putative tryptophan/tyrosine transport system substrate-binding protein
MRAKILVYALPALILATIQLADAQQLKKLARLGFLSLQFPETVSRPPIEAFRQRLRELGYIEKQNIVIEWRFANGEPERLPTLAAEIVGLNVDIIVAAGNPATRAAKQKTTTIPIVVVSGTNLIENGLVSSLARPGGNITGLSSFRGELSGKRLELLKEIVPKAVRFGILHSGDYSTLRELKVVAQTLRRNIEPFEVLEFDQLDSMFSTMNQQHIQALLVQNQSVFITRRQQILGLAAKGRLPGMYAWGMWTTTGGLSSYAVSDPDMYRRAATYVDKILKGTKPADLPIEQPMKFEFIINLKAAKEIGLTIPPNVLARADKVLK